MLVKVVILAIYCGILAAKGIPELPLDSVVKDENILSTAKVEIAR